MDNVQKEAPSPACQAPVVSTHPCECHGASGWESRPGRAWLPPAPQDLLGSFALTPFAPSTFLGNSTLHLLTPVHLSHLGLGLQRRERSGRSCLGLGVRP